MSDSQPKNLKDMTTLEFAGEVGALLLQRISQAGDTRDRIRQEQLASMAEAALAVLDEYIELRSRVGIGGLTPAMQILAIDVESWIDWENREAESEDY